MGVAEMNCRRCCIPLKTEKMFDGALSSGVVSCVRLGDCCVADVRGMLFTILRLHWLCVEIVLCSSIESLSVFWLLVGMRCCKPGVLSAVCPVRWWIHNWGYGKASRRLLPSCGWGHVTKDRAKNDFGHHC
jgi:hypothetical protein